MFPIRKSLISLLIVAFACNLCNAPVFAASIEVPRLPAPGTMVHLSPAHEPAYLKGIVIDPKNALRFDFLVHQGDSPLKAQEKQQEYNKLIKYFLASLTIPDADQWVNLSPYEKDRTIADDFGKTSMGRDLLAQDYLLKQITSSLMYPESGLGKEFWDKVYEKAGNVNIPVNTFSKVWIIPDEATIYESGNTAYVVKSHLKVMLEEDYLAKQTNSTVQTRFIASQTTNRITQDIIRQVILPELEKEVNEGQNFANLRQIFSSMLLATWYKKSLKESLLGKVYADKAKVKGVDTNPKNNEAIYTQYLTAFKKGVYNFVKETDLPNGTRVPMKYFAGGVQQNYAMITKVERVDHITLNQAMSGDLSNLDQASVDIDQNRPDAAMSASDFHFNNFDEFEKIARDPLVKEDLMMGEFIEVTPDIDSRINEKIDQYLALYKKVFREDQVWINRVINLLHPFLNGGDEYWDNPVFLDDLLKLLPFAPPTGKQIFSFSSDPESEQAFADNFRFLASVIAIKEIIVKERLEYLKSPQIFNDGVEQQLEIFPKELATRISTSLGGNKSLNDFFSDLAAMIYSSGQHLPDDAVRKAFEVAKMVSTKIDLSDELLVPMIRATIYHYGAFPWNTFDEAFDVARKNLDGIIHYTREGDGTFLNNESLGVILQFAGLMGLSKVIKDQIKLVGDADAAFTFYALLVDALESQGYKLKDIQTEDLLDIGKIVILTYSGKWRNFDGEYDAAFTRALLSVYARPDQVPETHKAFEQTLDFISPKMGDRPMIAKRMAVMALMPYGLWDFYPEHDAAMKSNILNLIRIFERGANLDNVRAKLNENGIFAADIGGLLREFRRAFDEDPIGFSVLVHFLMRGDLDLFLSNTRFLREQNTTLSLARLFPLDQKGGLTIVFVKNYIFASTILRYAFDPKRGVVGERGEINFQNSAQFEQVVWLARDKLKNSGLFKDSDDIGLEIVKYLRTFKAAFWVDRENFNKLMHLIKIYPDWRDRDFLRSLGILQRKGSYAAHSIFSSLADLNHDERFDRNFLFAKTVLNTLGVSDNAMLVSRRDFLQSMAVALNPLGASDVALPKEVQGLLKPYLFVDYSDFIEAMEQWMRVYLEYEFNSISVLQRQKTKLALDTAKNNIVEEELRRLWFEGNKAKDNLEKLKPIKKRFGQILSEYGTLFTDKKTRIGLMMQDLNISNSDRAMSGELLNRIRGYFARIKDGINKTPVEKYDLSWAQAYFDTNGFSVEEAKKYKRDISIIIDNYLLGKTVQVRVEATRKIVEELKGLLAVFDRNELIQYWPSLYDLSLKSSFKVRSFINLTRRLKRVFSQHEDFQAFWKSFEKIVAIVNQNEADIVDGYRGLEFMTIKIERSKKPQQYIQFMPGIVKFLDAQKGISVEYSRYFYELFKQISAKGSEQYVKIWDHVVDLLIIESKLGNTVGFFEAVVPRWMRSFRNSQTFNQWIEALKTFEHTGRVTPEFKKLVPRAFYLDDSDPKDVTEWFKKLGDLQNATEEITGEKFNLEWPSNPAPRLPIKQRNKFSNPRVKNPGGIDLNAAHVDLVIKKDGQGVPLPVSQQDLSMLSRIDGFVPRIIEIKPAASLPQYQSVVKQ